MDLKKLQNGSDIRGIALGAGATLTNEAAQLLAAAFVQWLEGKGVKAPTVAVGMDSRLSGPALKSACATGLTGMGANVIDCGMASTPAMFMTTVTAGFMANGAIMVTASHMPSDRNGLKFFTKDGGLEKADIADLISIAETGMRDVATPGTVTEKDFMSVYAAMLADKITDATGEARPFAGLKIIVDAGNGAGGFYVDKVLKPLGADTAGSQFLEPDGAFPNHIPNPEDPAAMQSIVDAVVRTGADFGVIFDTDVDRAGAVDAGGVVLNRNRLIAVISAILIGAHPGTTIVTDSVTSSGLADFIQGLGGKHHRFKRGYKNVINESIRLNSEGTDSQLAIETSGHAALKENYFLDDGAYLVTRILIEMAKLKKQGKTIADLIADLAEPAEGEEFRLTITAEDFASYGRAMLGELEAYVKEKSGFHIAPDNHEGIRVSFDKADGDGWFIVRLSLHDPVIPVNVESDSAGGVRVITQKLYDFLKKFDRLDLSSMEKYLEQ